LWIRDPSRRVLPMTWAVNIADGTRCRKCSAGGRSQCDNINRDRNPDHHAAQLPHAIHPRLGAFHRHERRFGFALITSDQLTRLD
jgi:hypothetical protein